LPVVTMRELLEAGVQYGHHTSRWNPKMAPYIFKKRHSIHVVNLRETVRGLVRARRFLTAIAEEKGEIVVVGTKRAASAAVEKLGTEAGVHWVAERWLGGILTNFSVVVGRVRRLELLEQLEESGEIEAKGKKFASVLRREMHKLQKNLQGIRNMKRLPNALILIDPRRERCALREAVNLNIPIISFMDTDSDPDLIDIVIPGNDDAMRSIRLICAKLLEAYVAGRARVALPEETEEEPATTPEPVEATPAAETAAAETAAAAPAEPAASVPPTPEPTPPTPEPTPPVAPEPKPAPEAARPAPAAQEPQPDAGQ